MAADDVVSAVDRLASAVGQRWRARRRVTQRDRTSTTLERTAEDNFVLCERALKIATDNTFGAFRQNSHAISGRRCETLFPPRRSEHYLPAPRRVTVSTRRPIASSSWWNATIAQMVSASDYADRMGERPLGSVRSSYVEFVANDGTTLRGMCWHGSDRWVLLVHDLGEDLMPGARSKRYSQRAGALAWRSISGVTERRTTRLGAATALTSTSRLPRVSGGGGRDVDRAIRRPERSRRGRSAARAAVRWDGTPLARSTRGPRSEFSRGQGTRKLFIVGSGDEALAKASSSLHRGAIGWRSR